MLPINLCFSFVLILGASSQVWGRNIQHVRATRSISTKIVSDIQNAVSVEHKRVKTNINNKLVSLKRNADLCSLQKKIRIESLKADYEDVDICLNLTVYQEQLEYVSNEAVNVLLEVARDVITIVNEVTLCTNNSDVFGCLANITSNLNTDLQEVIQDISTVSSQVVAVVLDLFIQAFNCLQTPSSFQVKLDEITNTKCNAEIKTFHRFLG